MPNGESHLVPALEIDENRMSLQEEREVSSRLRRSLSSARKQQRAADLVIKQIAQCVDSQVMSHEERRIAIRQIRAVIAKWSLYRKNPQKALASHNGV
jgi:hypothetical protein